MNLRHRSGIFALRRLADQGEALATEMAILFRELQAQRYAPVRVPRAVLERIQRLGRDIPAWLESVGRAFRTRGGWPEPSTETAGGRAYFTACNNPMHQPARRSATSGEQYA